MPWLGGVNDEGTAAPIAVIAAAFLAENGTIEIPQQPIQSAAVAADIIPVADPHVAGQLWKNAGVITISAG